MLHNFTVVVVEFIAVAMAFADVLRAVAAAEHAALCGVAGVCAKAQSAALIGAVGLVGQKVYDLVFRISIKFAGIGVFEHADVPRKFNYGNLHTKADSEIWNMVFTAVFCGFYHTLDSALAKAAGHNDSGTFGKLFCDIFGVHALAVNPVNLDVGAVGIARVAQRLRNGKVRIVKLNIFAHQTDVNSLIAVDYSVDHLFPLAHIKLRRVDIELAAYDF